MSTAHPPAFRPSPVSTYRLQLHAGFSFARALEAVPYLSDLGVTDCYLSPVFTARPGSVHGYDVCNHNEINPELGGDDGFADLAAALRARDMGVLLDFVPNHMGNDPQTNGWWRDVLENGPSSPFARYFDIDWDPIKPELKNRLLLPILGEQYGEALESGRLRLEFAGGSLAIDYGGYRLPVNPRRSPMVYETGLEALVAALGDGDRQLREFLSILTALRNLPPYTERDPARIAERQREKEVARDRLARLVDESGPIRRHVEAAVAAFNGSPGDPRSFDRIHELLEQQAYRLASWRTASDEINYRRFFDINDLAGLTVEDADVFDDIHRLVLRLVAEGTVTGLRLDHVDGLSDPAAYLERLRAATRAARAGGDDAATAAESFYVVVEKILSSGETLPASWATAGTTGYNFLNEVNGIFVNARHARSITRTYARLTGRADPVFEVEYDSKRLIIGTAMTSELQVLAVAINRLSEADRRSRDFTFSLIRRSLREVIACFPVYRTYVSAAGVGPTDRAIVDAAILMARLHNPASDPSIFDFLRSVLLPERPDDGQVEAVPHDRRLQVAMKIQQYTAPVQAKGVEDTAFYRHVPLLSLNEVGGNPRQFGRPVQAFHAANTRRRTHWPLEMNTTATHDTKRGEDGRARLNVLSELPGDWRDAVSKWMRVNKSLRRMVDSEPAPDRGDEYHFYQALLTAWPAEAHDAPVTDHAPHDLVERLRGYMTKAIREGKLHTSWINPNEAYETAVDGFVQGALAGDGAAKFLPLFVPFARRLARLGMVNSLGQLVLKLAAPGVSDVYQGGELWDLSLCDPDNRRPVDYAHRRTLLSSLEPLLKAADVTSPTSRDESSAVAALVDGWHDGRIKLFVTAAGLRLRRARPDVFLGGTYQPLVADGVAADHIVSFARERDGAIALAVVPRLLVSAPSHLTVTGPEAWRDTRLRLPDAWRGRVFRSVLTGAVVKPIRTAQDAWLMTAQALASCPVALLWSETDWSGA